MIEQFVFTKLSSFLRRVYADIDTPPILDADAYFPARQALKEKFKEIRRESVALFDSDSDIPLFHEVSSSQYRISDNDGKNWRVFLVKSYGHLVKANAAKVPELTKFLRDHPEVTTANISFLESGKHIPPHKGPFRGILRYHICLYAPDAAKENGPWLRVDKDTIPYSEGEDLLWDDTFMHEVLNPGPNPRIALLLDVRRPVRRVLHRAIFNTVLAGGRLYSVLNEKKMRAK